MRTISQRWGPCCSSHRRVVWELPTHPSSDPAHRQDHPQRAEPGIRRHSRLRCQPRWGSLACKELPTINWGSEESGERKASLRAKPQSQTPPPCLWIQVNTSDLQGWALTAAPWALPLQYFPTAVTPVCKPRGFLSPDPSTACLPRPGPALPNTGGPCSSTTESEAVPVTTAFTLMHRSLV